MTRETLRSIIFPALLMSAMLACASAVYAQDALPQATPQPTPLTAPPPFKMIVKEERSQIEQTNDSQKRLKLTIEFAAAHLTRAEQHTAREDYEAASAEVGMYHALIESALQFLSTFKRDTNKTRDLYKRLELALRADGPRLTAMRRVSGVRFSPRARSGFALAVSLTFSFPFSLPRSREALRGLVIDNTIRR